MGNISKNKKQRQQKLKEMIEQNPFLTDEELCDMFNVSIQTIRLDRMELGITEVRERLREVAAKSYDKVKTIETKEIIGELIDLKLGEYGISMLETKENMTFEKTKIVRGHYIYSLAETLAIAVIDAEAALIGVANIKYKNPIYANTHLVAKAEVKRTISNTFLVWVKIYEKQVEMFRGKFILVSLGNEKKE